MTQRTDSTMRKLTNALDNEVKRIRSKYPKLPRNDMEAELGVIDFRVALSLTNIKKELLDNG